MTNKLLLRLAIPFAFWLLIFYSSIIDMVGVWSQSKTYEHCYLIIPICLWLLWQDKDKLKEIPLSTSITPVILLLLPCLLWILGKTAHIAFFEHTAAIVSLQLIIWAMIGNQLAKKAYFPILYLVFCIPFGEELIPYLQAITADISVVLVRLVGIPIYREGMYLTVPNGQFEVAEACSGIRFLISSIALGTLFSHVFFKKWWKFSFFIVFSAIFPIIANGIRAFGIILIGNLSNMKYATGADHIVYGWVFFSIVIVIMFFIAWYLQDQIQPEENTASTTISSPSASQESTTSIVKTTGSISVIFIVFLLWNYSVSIYTQQEKLALPLPENFKLITASKWNISFPQADQTLLAQSPDGTTELFSARYYLKQQKGELISSENSFYNKNDWTVSDKKTYQNQNGSDIAELSLINRFGQSKKIIYWYCVNDYCSSNPLKIKFVEAYNLLLKNNIHADIVAISSKTSTSSTLQKELSDYEKFR